MRPKALILAGGKGTRLGELGQKVPKSLLPIAGKPLLSYQLGLLSEFGVNEVVLSVRHLAHEIQDFVRTGNAWGLRVQYVEEREPRGTAGAVRDAMRGGAQDFLVLYGDVMMNFDIARLQDYHVGSGALATLVLHPNDHPLDSDLVDIDREGWITTWFAKPHKKLPLTRNLVNAGACMMSPRLLEHVPVAGEVDFGREIFPALVGEDKHALRGYVTGEYFKDCGTPERVGAVSDDVAQGKDRARRAGMERPAAFLDRDGVINEEVDNLAHEDKLRLLPGVARAIARLNKAGVLVIVVTNQPVVAKGLASVEEVERIHRRLEMLLGEAGAYVDAIYWCPHHPERGFPGERTDYKISCKCRKPKIGLIEQAQHDFTIDMARSWMVGDSWRDIECGRRAKLATIGVETGYGCQDGKCTPRYLVPSLEGAVELVLRELLVATTVSIKA